MNQSLLPFGQHRDKASDFFQRYFWGQTEVSKERKKGMFGLVDEAGRDCTNCI